MCRAPPLVSKQEVVRRAPAVLLCVGQVEDRTRDQQRWTRAVSLWQEKVLLRYNSSADLEVDSALGALPVDLPLLRSEPYCLSRPSNIC